MTLQVPALNPAECKVLHHIWNRSDRRSRRSIPEFEKAFGRRTTQWKL